MTCHRDRESIDDLFRGRLYVDQVGSSIGRATNKKKRHWDLICRQTRTRDWFLLICYV
jgi:hypothetical protein